MQCTFFSAMSCAYERSLFVLQGCEIDTAERVSCGLRSYLLLACAIFGLGFSACGLFLLDFVFAVLLAFLGFHSSACPCFCMALFETVIFGVLFLF